MIKTKKELLVEMENCLEPLKFLETADKIYLKKIIMGNINKVANNIDFNEKK